MGFGMSCVKYMMFIFNFVFALAGLALLIVGALMQSKVASVSNFLEGKVSAPPIFLIVVGSIVFVIAFYGCCGAIRESSCMVTTFSIFLMVILVAEIALAVLAFVYRNEYQNVMSEDLAKSVANYGRNNITIDAEVDTIQSMVSTHQISFRVLWSRRPLDYTGRSPPKSCCVISDSACSNLSDANQVFQVGCTQAMKDFISNLGLLIGCLAIVVAFVIIMGIIFGLCLANSIRNEIRRGYA